MRPIPVRVYPVYAGTGPDDPEKRIVSTLRNEAIAQAFVVGISDLKSTQQLVGDEQYWQAPLDTELEFASVADAIAQGYQVRALVIRDEDVPEDGVIATLVATNAGAGVLTETPVEEEE